MLNGIGYGVGNSGKPAATGSSENPGLAFQSTPMAGWTNMTSNCDYRILQTPHAGVLITGLGDGSVKAVSSSISTTTWGNACNALNTMPLGSDW